MKIGQKLTLMKLLLQTVLFFVLLFLIPDFALRTCSGYPNDHARVELVRRQLSSLRIAFHDQDAARKMQQYFPEGACFALTLYGLAWSNIARTSAGELHADAAREIDWAIREQGKPYVIASFQNTEVPQGVFYLGQTNLLIGQYLEILEPARRPATLVDRYHKQSLILRNAFLASPTRHLSTYPGDAWPADNVTALASLLLHDELYGTHYRDAYDSWKAFTTDHADPATSMTPGMINVTLGTPAQPARGCGNSWSLALLAHYDPAYAREQYTLYKRYFAINRLGFQMFREYPAGHGHRADVDSGPIIWSAGVVATGVGLAAARANGDLATARDIHQLANAFGWPRRIDAAGNPGVHYLFGLLPMGDAFLAWGYSVPAPDAVAPGSGIPDHWPFYCFMFILLLILMLRGWFIWRNWLRWRNPDRPVAVDSDKIRPKEIA